MTDVEAMLDELGLGSLPPDEKRSLVAAVTLEMEDRVGYTLSEGLSNKQVSEFESFVAGDVSASHTWLEEHVPDYRVHPVMVRLQASNRTMPPGKLLCELASVMWLKVNRPDYKSVVSAAMAELREELAQRVPEILGSQPDEDGVLE